jgi:hypothetical protein
LIYYDTPYYAYQDKIISFAVVAYICLFFTAQRSDRDVPPALVTLWVTVLGLCAINLSPALSSVLDGNRPSRIGFKPAFLPSMPWHCRSSGCNPEEKSPADLRLACFWS